MTEEEAKLHEAKAQYCKLFWKIKNIWLNMHGVMPLTIFIQSNATSIQQLGMWYRQIIKLDPKWEGK